MREASSGMSASKNTLFIVKLIARVMKIKFIRYFTVGVLATIVDWSAFYICAILLNFYYQPSLVIAFSLGSLTNYILNKSFTFECTSEKILKQFSVFMIIATSTLLLSMLVMFILIDLLAVDKMISRVLTTFLMLVINYLLHKNLTFNKRFFK